MSSEFVVYTPGQGYVDRQYRGLVTTELVDAKVFGNKKKTARWAKLYPGSKVIRKRK